VRWSRQPELPRRGRAGLRLHRRHVATGAVQAAAIAPAGDFKVASSPPSMPRLERAHPPPGARVRTSNSEGLTGWKTGDCRLPLSATHEHAQPRLSTSGRRWGTPYDASTADGGLLEAIVEGLKIIRQPVAPDGADKFTSAAIGDSIDMAGVRREPNKPWRIPSTFCP
jgi:hypothetical protein